MGVWLITAAFRLGRTSAVAPLRYLRLVLLATTGRLLYGKVPTLATVVGGLLTIATERQQDIDLNLREGEPK